MAVTRVTAIFFSEPADLQMVAGALLRVSHISEQLPHESERLVSLDYEAYDIPDLRSDSAVTPDLQFEQR